MFNLRVYGRTSCLGPWQHLSLYPVIFFVRVIYLFSYSLVLLCGFLSGWVTARGFSLLQLGLWDCSYRISQNSPGFFCLCLALFSALGLSYWHQFSQVHTCSNKSLTCGLEGWTQLLAGVGVSWSSSTLQGIHLQAQFKPFLFFLFLLIDQKDFELLPFRPLF